MELPRGARRCEKADSIGGEWGFPRRSFVREWEHFAKKVGEAKRENALPRITVLQPLVISSAARNLPCTTVKRDCGMAKSKSTRAGMKTNERKAYPVS